MRLINKIEAGMDGRLVLVSAPAGFGKSTLVASWIESTERSIAWLSLEKNENDIHRFLQYLVASFQRVDEELGAGIQSALESQTTFQNELMLTKLIDEVSQLNRPLSLVLDDFHLIENEQIHSAVEFLIHHMPANANVILIGRLDPPIPLSRLRTGGELLEIRSDWINSCGLNASDEPTFFREVEQLILARAMLYQVRQGSDDVVLDELLAFLEVIREAVNRSGWISKEIEALLLQSMTLQLGGAEGRALNLLESALRLAESGGFIRPLVDEGTPIGDMLNERVRDVAQEEYYRKLMHAFEDPPEPRNETDRGISLQHGLNPSVTGSRKCSNFWQGISVGRK